MSGGTGIKRQRPFAGTAPQSSSCCAAAFLPSSLVWYCPVSVPVSSCDGGSCSGCNNEDNAVALICMTRIQNDRIKIRALFRPSTYSAGHDSCSDVKLHKYM